jgi:hypothetical protein
MDIVLIELTVVREISITAAQIQASTLLKNSPLTISGGDVSKSRRVYERMATQT